MQGNEPQPLEHFDGAHYCDRYPFSGIRAGSPTQAASACQWEQALAEAERVAIIPGYGMAVAQAQLQVKELIDLLEAGHKRGEGGHSSRGRAHAGTYECPLAEVDVPYEKLHDMEAINEFLPGADCHRGRGK